MDAESHSRQQNLILTAPSNTDALFERAYDVASKVASTRVGQFAIKQIDKFLWTVEKTAKWSIPAQETNKEQKGSHKNLVKPLPWIPFLAAIIALRTFRVGLSLGSVLIGNESISPEDIVNFIQIRRRKLRTIKYHGLHAMRLKKQEATERKRRGVLGKLSNIFHSSLFRAGKITASKKQKKSKDIQMRKKRLLHELLNLENPLQCLQPVTKKENSAKIFSTEGEDDVVVASNSNSNSNSSSNSSTSNNSSNISNLNISGSEPESTSEDSGTEDSPSKEININTENISKVAAIMNSLSDTKEKLGNRFESIRNEIEAHIEKSIDESIIALTNKLEENTNDSGIKEEEEAESVIDNPSSVSMNPTKLSPKIAHNGNIENDQQPNKDRPVSRDEIDTKGSPKPGNFVQNHITNDKKRYEKEKVNTENFSTAEKNAVKTNLQVHLKQPNNKKFTNLQNNNRINARKAN